MSDSLGRKRILPIELSDGSTLRVEVDGPAGGDVAALKMMRIADLRQEISKIAGLVSDAVHDIKTPKPTKVGVEFGLKLVVESSALVSALAKAGGEATFIVRLEWDQSA